MRRLLSLVVLVGLTLVAPIVHADSGVSDERVSLPDGPGSVGGVGDNVDLDVNMGSMLYQVPVEVPEGFGTATPQVSLSYSSGGGAGEVGVGWSMGVSSIDRMRLHGLPEYTEADEFAADGGGELVRVSATATSAVYRARNERGFIRYQWYGRAPAGAAGYWTAEYPDGTIAYYGADETAAHTPVRTARVETATGGVYRYLLVARVDAWGHAIHYRYVKDGETSLLDEITYVDTASGPRFSVRFAYEARGDNLSTGEPGFELILSQRLREIQVRSGSETIRRYLLTYESAAGGVSRLAGVETRGRLDATMPARFTFAYSRSLDGACSGACEGPFMVDMGALPAGVDLINGRSTLLDINGDALPDVLETSATGRHTFVPSVMDVTTGQPRFGAGYSSTATPGASTFILGNPGVQVLDVNGDGFTDIISSRTGQVLCNDGSGDWNGSSCIMNSTLPVLDADGTGDSNPLHVRFLDYDDDKRIDLIRTTTGSSEVFVNTGTAFVQRAVQDIGAVFDDSPTLQFADLNGDGLQDPVEILTGGDQLRFRTNLGFGTWGPWEFVSLAGFGGADVSLLSLEDINGDGLADVVLVAGNEVRYAVNQNAGTFAPVVRLTSAEVTGDLPSRVPGTTTVLFADMNGSGSNDIVWIDGGHVQFLELFPVRPNLLSRVENGLGGVQTIEYGTSVLQQARDAATAPWAHRLPNAMNVVVGMDVWNRLFADETTGLHDRSSMTYRDGYYDGVDRAFRGFGHVERIETSDLATDGQTGAQTVFDYDLGLTDATRHRHGLMLKSARFGGAPGAWSPMLETRTTWGDCAVAEVPAGLPVPVRWPCEQSVITIVQEGAPEAEWRTTRTEQEYDGYGAKTLVSNLGVVNLGSPEAPTACGACAPGSGPCGPTCAGDEAYVRTTYVQPGAATSGAWILGKPVRRTTFGELGGAETEQVTRYDGSDFSPLAEGQLTRGAATSVRDRVDASAWVDSQRVRYDANGNIVEEIFPNGSLAVTDDYRRQLTYDDLGLRVARVDDLFHDRSGAPVALRREYTYESAFYDVSEATSWMLVRGGAAVTARNAERYRYDSFGRPSAILKTGDVEATPTEEFSYEAGSPVTRIVTRSRSVMGGAVDSEEILCLDGQGRQVQSRTRIADGDYQVSGFQVLNRRGKAVRAYDEYVSPSGACDMAAPTSVPFETFTYDALDRVVETTESTDSVAGARSTLRAVYGPLRTSRYDAEDNDASGPHAGTPLVEQVDGLDRVVSATRDLGGGVTATTTLDYDSLGRLASVHAPDGVEHSQSYDLLGRVVSALDPDRGMIAFAYDAAGHIVQRTDARGAVTAAEYDGVGRLVAQWDPTADAATRTEVLYDEDTDCTGCTNGARRIVGMRYPLGELGMGRDELGYDARGNGTLEARTLGGTRFVSQFSFDAIGRLTRSAYPGGIAFDRTYDQGSRPTGISGILDDIAYDDQGRIATLFYANGTRGERSYDDAGRLEALETRRGTSVLQGVSMTRDRAGNVLTMSDTSETAGTRPSLSGRFSYDSLYRLQEATYGEPAADEETLNYTYDIGDRPLSVVSSLGARSRAHVGALTYDPEHPNAVLHAGVLDYEYDASGHTTRRGTTSLAYDHLGRLESATGEAGKTGEFFYGAASKRVARVENGSVTYYLGDEAEVRDGVVSVYPRLGTWRVGRLRSASVQTGVLTDVAPLAAGDDEINAADAWVSVATAAGIVDGAPGASKAMWLLSGAARRLLALDGGDVAFLHQDNLGSTSLATAADGSVAGETFYYPSGEVRYRTGFVDEHGYSGQEEDESTGLLAYQFRELDTQAGRWTSPDPAFETLTPAGVERLGEATSGYAYVANHYGNAIDELGLAGLEAAAPKKSAGPPRLASVAPPPPKPGFVGKAKAFMAKHPFLVAAAKVALSAAIGFAIGGPIGAAAGAIMSVASQVAGKSVGALIKNTRAGRAVGRTVGRGWNHLGKSAGGKVLKGVLIVGAIAGAITAMALGAPEPLLAAGGGLINITTSAVVNQSLSLGYSALTASVEVANKAAASQAAGLPEAALQDPGQ